MIQILLTVLIAVSLTMALITGLNDSIKSTVTQEAWFTMFIVSLLLLIVAG